MSCRTIHSADSSVPHLALPPGALAHMDCDYDYDVDRDPPNVEPIEHQIRLGFMHGGAVHLDQLLGDYNPWSYKADTPATHPWRGVTQKPRGLDYAEASCDVRIREEETFYEHADDDTVLVDAPAYLAARIREASEQSDPHEAVSEVRKDREKWYQELIPGANLRQILKESSYGSLVEKCIGPTPDANSLLEHNAFVGMVSSTTTPTPTRSPENAISTRRTSSANLRFHTRTPTNQWPSLTTVSNSPRPSLSENTTAEASTHSSRGGTPSPARARTSNPLPSA